MKKFKSNCVIKLAREDDKILSKLNKKCLVRITRSNHRKSAKFKNTGGKRSFGTNINTCITNKPCFNKLLFVRLMREDDRILKNQEKKEKFKNVELYSQDDKLLTPRPRNLQICENKEIFKKQENPKNDNCELQTSKQNEKESSKLETENSKRATEILKQNFKSLVRVPQKVMNKDASKNAEMVHTSLNKPTKSTNGDVILKVPPNKSILETKCNDDLEIVEVPPEVIDLTLDREDLKTFNPKPPLKSILKKPKEDQDHKQTAVQKRQVKKLSFSTTEKTKSN